MARSIWRGSISLGLVTIPIKLYVATESKDISFHLLHKGCNTRVKQQRYCPSEDTVIAWGDVVRGYEYADDQYVIMEDGDFAKLPLATVRTIEIAEFVSLDEVDPQYFEKSYYIEPDPVGKRAYALLRQTLESTRRVALGKLALRQKEQLCVLRARDDVLIAHTMYLHDELRDVKELDIPEVETALPERELEMARSLVDALTNAFDPSKYRDEYREALNGLIEEKLSGGALTPAPEPQGKVVDLMESLKASVEAARKKRAEEAKGGGKAAAAVPDVVGSTGSPQEEKPLRRRKAG